MLEETYFDLADFFQQHFVAPSFSLEILCKIINETAVRVNNIVLSLLSTLGGSAKPQLSKFNFTLNQLKLCDCEDATTTTLFHLQSKNQDERIEQLSSYR
jgi:hypothetical protein